VKGRRIKVFDDSYCDFLDVLQKLGELGRLQTLIYRLEGRDEEAPDCHPDCHPWTEEELGRNRAGALHTFWDRGWIEVREIHTERKSGPVRQYRVQVRLDKIGQYFDSARMVKSIEFDQKAAISCEATAVARAEAWS
jgi:hypothetical protein